MTLQRTLSIEEISSKLKPILGKKIDELYFRYSMSESPEERNQIIQILSALYQKYLGQFLERKVLLEPPTQSVVSGNYELAKVIYANKELFPFALREQDWPRHVCISGMSGSGKTTLALNILQRFIEKDKPFLVFDWKKSFRSLINTDPSVMCFTVGNDSISNLFKTNINIPPKGVSPKEWINTLCDLLTESFCVSFGVHKILLETLDEVFEGWEVYKGSQHYPNWMHIKKMLEIKAREAKGREATWYESALRIASVLTFGDFGKVINYDGKKSLSVEELFDKKVIFELNSLGNVEKKFFAEYILTYIFKLKKANSEKSQEGFNHAILVDEAHNIFLKSKTYFVSESVTDMIYREMREYGTCLICLDQHISKLSDTVKGNSACHIAFQQQLPQDVYDVSSIMQLPEKREIFTQLPVGFAVVKLSERYTLPFLVKVPYTDLRNSTISDENITDKMDCVIQGIEVEKSDPEFREALTGNNITEQKYSVASIIDESMKEKPMEIPEIPRNKEDLSEKKEVTGLTPVQDVLYDFIKKQVEKGRTIKEAEKMLEEGLPEKLYKEADIFLATNYALGRVLTKTDYLNSVNKNRFSDNEEYFVSQDVDNNVIEFTYDNNLSKNKTLSDEDKFTDFLRKNPSHTKSTVEIYNIIGLSTRKGNILKNKLLTKGLIKVQEERSDKGWKKIIRLSK
ncbi:MAG: ATP-binding protein [Nanobdellota archaeon]